MHYQSNCSFTKLNHKNSYLKFLYLNAYSHFVLTILFQDPLSVNPACQDGCSFRKDELNIKIKTLPFSPISPPTLVKLYNSSLTSEKRLFSVNLTSAAGGRMDEDGPNWNGFLFRIHDIDSGNITYVWQVIKSK